MVSLKRILLVLLLIVLWMGCKSMHADGVLEGGSKFVRMKDGEDTAALAKIIDDKIPVDCDRARNGDHAYVTIRLYAKHEDMINLCHNYFHSNLVNPIPGHQGYGPVPPVMPFQPGYFQPIPPGTHSTSPDPFAVQRGAEPFPGAPFYAQQHSISRPMVPVMEQRELQRDITAPQMTQGTSNYYPGNGRQHSPSKESYESTAFELESAKARIANLEQELEQANARNAELQQVDMTAPQNQMTQGTSNQFAAASSYDGVNGNGRQHYAPKEPYETPPNAPLNTAVELDNAKARIADLEQELKQWRESKEPPQAQFNAMQQTPDTTIPQHPEVPLTTQQGEDIPRDIRYNTFSSETAFELRNAELQREVERLQSELSRRAQPMEQHASTKTNMDEKVGLESPDESDVPPKRAFELQQADARNAELQEEVTQLRSELSTRAQPKAQQPLKSLIEKVKEIHWDSGDDDPLKLEEFEQQVHNLEKKIDQTIDSISRNIRVLEISHYSEYVQDAHNLQNRLLEIKAEIEVGSRAAAYAD